MIPERRKREIRAREAELADRQEQRANVLTGLDGADPTEAYDWSRALVRCRYLRGAYYGLTCRAAYMSADAGFELDMEPNTVCAACNRPLGEHTPRLMVAPPKR